MAPPDVAAVQPRGPAGSVAVDAPAATEQGAAGEDREAGPPEVDNKYIHTLHTCFIDIEGKVGLRNDFYYYHKIITKSIFIIWQVHLYKIATHKYNFSLIFNINKFIQKKNTLTSRRIIF